VAAEIAELKPRPLLIAVTAYGGVYTEELARAAGFDHYLVKPADPLAVEALVRSRARPGP
jgi:CheY-like chemotaxis protein